MKNKMKPRIALVLGSGGTRGFAHLGVVSVLEEHNIEYDLIAGCSVGSMVGALLAFGLKPKKIYDITVGLGRDTWIKFVMPKMGLISTKNMHEIINILVKNQSFDEATKKLFIVATELSEGKEVVFTKGDVADAVCASSAIPAIFEAVDIDGKLYVDGSVVDPLPVSILPKNEFDFIIGVDLSNKGSFQNIKNIYQVIFRSLEIMHGNLEKYKDARDECDILIRPDFTKLDVKNMMSFDFSEEYYNLGREKALEALPKIKKMINDFYKANFHKLEN